MAERIPWVQAAFALSGSSLIPLPQAIESARLLLRSVGSRHPSGRANGSGQVGKNLLFAGGGAGLGRRSYAKFGAEQAETPRQVA